MRYARQRRPLPGSTGPSRVAEAGAARSGVAGAAQVSSRAAAGLSQ